MGVPCLVSCDQPSADSAPKDFHPESGALQAACSLALAHQPGSEDQLKKAKERVPIPGGCWGNLKRDLPGAWAPVASLKPSLCHDISSLDCPACWTGPPGSYWPLDDQAYWDPSLEGTCRALPQLPGISSWAHCAAQWKVWLYRTRD